MLSKNRQDWINTLRDCLSEYNAIMYDVFADMDSGGRIRDPREGVNAWIRANVIRSKVTLLMNPSESRPSTALGFNARDEELCNTGQRGDCQECLC